MRLLFSRVLFLLINVSARMTIPGMQKPHCTPPFSRSAVVADCVRAAKHMFSEKPFTLDLEF